MTNLRKDNDQQQEAQRHLADQASREQPKLDVVSVFYAVQVKISEGRIAEARQMWLDYKRSK
jgi:hypothetical protein